MNDDASNSATSALNDDASNSATSASDNAISFHSIKELRAELNGSKYSATEIYDYFTSNYEAIQGSETDYHNLSVDFSDFSETFSVFVAQVGVKNYPLSADLLADVIKYAQEIGDLDACKKGFLKLQAIDKKYWTWRTFVFVIDFLKDGLSQSKDVSAFEADLKEAWKFIDEFKRWIPYDERAYLAAAEVYQRQNEHDNAIKALLEGTEKCAVAPMCCLKLSDIYMELGRYKDVEKYARKGILAALQEQPSVSVGYLYFLLAMSMDAQRIQAKQTDRPFGKDKIQAIVTAYQTADDLLVNERRLTVSYRSTIQARLIIIEKEEGVSAETKEPSDEEKQDFANFLQELAKHSNGN